MKKFIVIFLTVSFLFVLVNSKKNLKAEAGYVKNILDLSNIMIRDDRDHSDLKWFVKTITPINVKEGYEYTLILGQDMYSHRTWRDQIVDGMECFFGFYDDNGNRIIGISRSLYLTDSYCYVTFTALSSKFEITEVPVDAYEVNKSSFDIMLYEGDITKFNGEFVSYNTILEPIQGVYIKDFDIDLTVEDILNNLGVTDNYKEDLIINIIEDSYTNNIDKLGEYIIKLSVKDDAHNINFYNLTIRIIDVTSPVITGINHYTIESEIERLGLSNILENIFYYDNVSTLNEADLEIVLDEYTTSNGEIGTYKLTFKVTDESTNYSFFDVIVDIVDTTAPTITGPLEIYRYTTDKIVDVKYIKEIFTAYDLVDGDLTSNLVLVGEYVNEPGRHELFVEVTDSSGNTASKRLYINVVDGKMPVYIPSELILKMESYINMDHEDLKTWLKENINSDFEFTILLDETLYKKNSKEDLYIYYSYEVDQVVFYGRLTVTPKAQGNHKTVIISVLGIINLSFLLVYLKRPKIHI